MKTQLAAQQGRTSLGLVSKAHSTLTSKGYMLEAGLSLVRPVNWEVTTFCGRTRIEREAGSLILQICRSQSHWQDYKVRWNYHSPRDGSSVLVWDCLLLGMAAAGRDSLQLLTQASLLGGWMPCH